MVNGYDIMSDQSQTFLPSDPVINQISYELPGYLIAKINKNTLSSISEPTFKNFSMHFCDVPTLMCYASSFIFMFRSATIIGKTFDKFFYTDKC